MKEFLFGAIQGLTEFIPVSSSGHLQWLQHFVKTDDVFLFTIIAHLGTWLAILIFYRRSLKHITTHLLSHRKENIFFKLVIASIPAGGIGLFLLPYVDQLFENLHWSVFGFILTGLLLFGTRFIISPKQDAPFETSIQQLKLLSFRQVFAMGVAQSFALFPGMSRVGWTSAVGIYMGLRPATALHFSFIMGFISIMGASIIEMATTTWSQTQITPLIICFTSSFLFGFVALQLMQKWVWKLYQFSFYLLFISVLGLIYLYFI